MNFSPESEEALIVLDARGFVRNTTPRAAILLGLQARELVGRPWSDIHPPDHLRVSMRIHEMQGKVRKSRLSLVSLTPVTEAGTHGHLIESWESSAELAVVFGPDGRMLAVNSAFARKFGTTAASWIGRDPAELVHPDDFREWRANTARIGRPPHRTSHEHRWQTAQGWRWLGWEDYSLRDPAGRLIAVRSIGRDVTKRRLAEEHFQKLASIVDQSPLSVVLTMPDGRVEYVNPRFAQVSGYTLEEIFENRIEVMRAGFRDEDYAACLQTVRSGQSWRGELHISARSGRERWEIVQISPIRDHLDRVTHLLCLREDVTERKQLEAQLRQAQKMESLGTLAGGISHDFNNLLAIVTGFCELARLREPADEKVAHYLAEIHEAARRASELVRQILTFSRKQGVRMVPGDLNLLVEDLVRMFTQTFPRNIEFVTELEEGLPLVKSDANQFQQVVMNLCVNARDAMPGGGRLILRTAQRSGAKLAHLGAPPGTDYASLEVSDTGHGMSEEVAARIFEPFFTTKEPNGGTGLGLAVVYGIVTSHGGLLEVTSKEGEGTTFSIHLPLPEEKGEEAVNLRPRPSVIPPGTESILVVEDEPAVHRLLCTALGNAGYCVFSAHDGAEAIDFIVNGSDPVQAVFLDINLPQVDGLRVLNVLRETRPSTRVIVISGHMPVEVREELERPGDLEIIEKPCGLDQLGKILRRVLDAEAAAV